MNRNYIILGGVILLALIAGLIFSMRKDDASTVVVTNYVECVDAGYTITGSDCITPDGVVYSQTPTPPSTSTTTPTGTTGKENLIRVTSPLPNQTVSSPFVITGEARGTWFFEASFPIRIVDTNGKVLGTAIAQAIGEWMTEDFVPFKATMTFTAPGTPTGNLFFHKDNPSGLPENDDVLIVPVKFSAGAVKEQVVKLYYYDSSKDKDNAGNILCSSKGLVAVNRNIPITMTPIQDTIKELIKGNLTAAERASGLSTEFPLAGVSLTGASLSGGNLKLSFNDPQNKTSGGSCRVTVLRAQIEATAKQFTGVNTVSFIPAGVFQP